MIPRIRPVRLDDLDSLVELSRATGFGLTTLPPDRDLLERRIIASLQAFEQRLKEPAGQAYLLVLESQGKVLGTTGLMSKTGGFAPFYSYEVIQEHFESRMLGISRDVQVLKLARIHNGPGEIGSLVLAREGRGQGHGGLLSRCRFLFMAEHPHLFERTIIAELRGVVDDRGNSPFWDAIGRQFFGLDYPQADYLVVKSKEFIEDLMPRYPIYVPLLPEAAREVIGKVHPHTRPALHMLEAEGFTRNGMIDIFEAGPTVSCELDRIRTVRESVRAEVVGIEDTPQLELPCLLGSTDLAFRACSGSLREEGPGRVRLPAAVAVALGVEPGNAVRYLPK